MQALLTRVIACDSMGHLCVCQLMSISVWRLDQQPWVMQKTSFLGQWSIFCAGMERFCCLQSGARSFCLSAEVQNAPKSVMRGSLKGKEQEHGQSISRRGWEGCVFDKADTELQDCNSFKDIFYFSPLVTELTPMVFDITRMTWWDYRCLFLVASCLWYI